MIFQTNIEDKFFESINVVLKDFCNKYRDFGFIYKELTPNEIFERLNKHKTVFMSAYYSYLEPRHNLSTYEIINIAFCLYERNKKEQKTIRKFDNKYFWLNINDPLEIFDITNSMNINFPTLNHFYQFYQENKFYFLINDRYIYFGVSFSKEGQEVDIQLIKPDEKLPEPYFKPFVDKLLEDLDIQANLQYKVTPENKKIKNFKDGSYWSYISNIKDIQNFGKFQNNELQEFDFANDYNNDMELYFLFNKENQPLLLASFNREDQKIGAIYSGEGKKISKVFEPYVDYILEYKNSEDVFIDYEDNSLH